MFEMLLKRLWPLVIVLIISEQNLCQPIGNDYSSSGIGKSKKEKEKKKVRQRLQQEEN